MFYKLFLICLFLGFFQLVRAQQAAFTRESWVENPRLHQPDKKYMNEPAIILLDRRRIEYIDETKEVVTELYTQHDLVKVNDAKGIEQFNRIYLGAANSIEIIDVKARTILPNGRIVEIDKNNVKDLKEQDGGTYKIFAVEGLEIGCELEYIYTYKKESSYFGKVRVQSGHPVLQSEFELISPERLIFEIKPYNLSVKPTDTIIDAKRILHVAVQDVAALGDEKYASYEVNLKRLEYKLSYNNATGKGQRLFTWNEMAKRVYTNYTSYKDKELSRISNLISQNGWDKLADEEQKIIQVENYIKKNYTTRMDIDGSSAADLEMVIKNKIASFTGIMRLYGAIFQQLQLNFQFVYVADRNDMLIDKSFENWNNCESPLFYFPDRKKYLAPTRLDFRFPFIFPSWGAANGVYCKGTSIGGFNTAIAEIRPVTLLDYSQSYSNLESSVELNTGGDSLLIDMKQLYGGYQGVYYRAEYNFSNAEEKRQLNKEMVRFGTNSENVISTEIINPEMEAMNTNKPFIFHAKVKASQLIENAGNKLLIKIGEIIGPQVEMYQDKPRQLPVKIEYPHFEERIIKFTIPSGYQAKNLQDLNLEHVYKENGEITMGFSSTWTIKENILTIHIMEEYRKTIYPIEQFDEFRKIINTSADFNKIVLVLEKK